METKLNSHAGNTAAVQNALYIVYMCVPESYISTGLRKVLTFDELVHTYLCSLCLIS